MNKLTKTIIALLILGLMLFSTISFAILSVSALTIDSVSILDEIIPGGTSRISIGLENDGDEDIEEVSVVLDLTNVPFAPFNSASEYSIDKIREDKTKFAEFEIIALNNAKSGIYKIPLLISYKIAGEDEKITKNSLISIVVNSKPIIDVNVEDSLLLKDKNNEILIRVTNKGLSDAKFVELIVNKGQFNLLSSDRHYIGDIDSDDFDSLKLKVFFKENVPNNVNLPVTIIYKDDLNKEYREEFNINLKVYTKQRAIELGLMKRNRTAGYVVGIVLIVVLYIIYRNLKKRAKSSKSK